MDTRSVLIGTAAGSALMFLLDPIGGRRRRALMRDQAVRATRKTRDGLDATARDLANRASGIAATVRERWSDAPVGERSLVARVRAKLGRVCSHPRAIDVDGHDGHVTLRGPVLASEVDAIIGAVASVRGVETLNNELDAHETAAGIPALQGGGRIAGSSLDILRSDWAPGTRAIVGAGIRAAGAWLAVATTRGARHQGGRYGAM